MRQAVNNPVLRWLRGLAAPQEAGALTDAGLLERFAARREEAAFAELVRRHGPLVLGVCRRLLRHDADAEDAFQATFLVLARRAGSITRPGSLASFLYGVAQRVARKARTAAARRQAREEPLHDQPAIKETPAWERHELQVVLDEEVGRLPERYRVPFVLCHLQGQTNEEAARQLGRPLGTVLAQLSRARARLRTRLARRGLVLSGAALAVACGGASGAVPPVLAEAALRGALTFAPGKAAAAGTVSASAAALAEGVLHAMFRTRLLTTVTVFLAVCAAGAGVGLFALQGFAQKAEEKKQEKDRRAARDGDRPAAARDPLRGTWVTESAEFSGKQLDLGEKDVPAEITFDDGKLTTRNKAGDAVGGTYTVDAKKEPKTLDLVPEDGPAKGKTFAAIYQVDGDRLKFCSDAGQGDRPTTFATVEGTEHMLVVLKRKK
jgi:RNA polymerase sigma factor (sigma-70 family)